MLYSIPTPSSYLPCAPSHSSSFAAILVHELLAKGEVESPRTEEKMEENNKERELHSPLR